jgi:hypothetical protein
MVLLYLYGAELTESASSPLVPELPDVPLVPDVPPKSIDVLIFTRPFASTTSISVSVTPVVSD